jgi:hypothetical protein
MVKGFFDNGYCRFGYDPELANWVAVAHAPAMKAVEDPELRAKWMLCQGTWFVGVDALDNQPDGSMAGVALEGAAMRFARSLAGPVMLHPAQVSVVWSGYPKPREGESDMAYRYRLNRDAAHLDGLKAIGPDRQRRIDEVHAWILGIPLNSVGPGASPMVVWQGSHEVIRMALLKVLDGVAVARWREVDLTEVYQAARRVVFETCPRVELSAQPGEAYLLHRLCLHGVAPWRGGVQTGPEGRMVAYFRPEMPGGPEAWLRAD